MNIENILSCLWSGTFQSVLPPEKLIALFWVCYLAWVVVFEFVIIFTKLPHLISNTEYDIVTGFIISNLFNFGFSAVTTFIGLKNMLLFFKILVIISAVIFLKVLIFKFYCWHTRNDK